MKSLTKQLLKKVFQCELYVNFSNALNSKMAEKYKRC
jgi:hypothetical protein